MRNGTDPRFVEHSTISSAVGSDLLYVGYLTARGALAVFWYLRFQLSDLICVGFFTTDLTNPCRTICMYLLEQVEKFSFVNQSNGRFLITTGELFANVHPHALTGEPDFSEPKIELASYPRVWTEGPRMCSIGQGVAANPDPGARSTHLGGR